MMMIVMSKHMFSSSFIFFLSCNDDIYVCVCNQIINKIEIIHQHAFIFLLLLLLLHVFSTAWHTHVCMYIISVVIVCHCQLVIIAIILKSDPSLNKIKHANQSINQSILISIWKTKFFHFISKHQSVLFSMNQTKKNKRSTNILFCFVCICLCVCVHVCYGT